MKTTLLFLLFCSSAFGQDTLLYRQKVDQYKTMRTNGNMMVVAGLMAVVGGVIIYDRSKPDTDMNDVNVFKTSVDNTALAIMAISAGASLFAGGAAVWSVGSRKMKEYQQKLELSLADNSVGVKIVLKL